MLFTKNIVFLVSPKIPDIFLVNKIALAFPKRTIHIIFRKNFLFSLYRKISTCKALLFIISRTPSFKKRYQLFYANNHHCCANYLKNIQVHTVEHIVSANVQKLLQELNAQILITHNVPLIPQNMIPPTAITINIHHGLAPYYRGCRCVEQALLRSDILNLGVTLHQLSEKIDAGNIYVQKKIIYELGDSREIIHQKIILSAVDLLIQIINGTLSGKRYTTTPQNIKLGKLYLIKEWNKSKQKLLTRKRIYKPRFKAKSIFETLAEENKLY